MFSQIDVKKGIVALVGFSFTKPMIDKYISFL